MVVAGRGQEGEERRHAAGAEGEDEEGLGGRREFAVLTGQRENKSEIQGSFAALRMTWFLVSG